MPMKREFITEDEMAAIEKAAETLSVLLRASENKEVNQYIDRYMRVILRLRKALTA